MKLEEKIVSLEGGLEPPTLWLTATRSNQLSYSSYLSNIKKITSLSNYNVHGFAGFNQALICSSAMIPEDLDTQNTRESQMSEKMENFRRNEEIPIISISSSEDEEKQGEEEEAAQFVSAHRSREEEYKLLSDLSGFENLRALMEGEALIKLKRKKRRRRRRKKHGEMRDSEFQKLADLTGFENLKALIEGEAMVKMGMRKNKKDCAFSRIEVERERDMEFRMVSDPPGIENLRALSEGEALMKMSKGRRRRKRKKNDVFAKAEKKRRDMEYRMIADLSGFENLKALIEGKALIKSTRRRRGEEEEKRDTEFHAPEQISVAATLEKETLETREAESLEILECIPEEFAQSSAIVVTSSEEKMGEEKEDKGAGAVAKESRMIGDQTGLGSFASVIEGEAFSKKRARRRRRRKKKHGNFDAQQQLPVCRC